MIDLLNLQPQSAPKDARDYSMLIMGASKIGKTTFASEFFGKDETLFIATEDRHKVLTGAVVQRVSNWSEYKQVLSQLRNPKLKERFKYVVVDTIDNLYAMCNKFILGKFNEEFLGDRNDLWGKDWTSEKNEWESGVKAIADMGYLPVFITHTAQQEETLPASAFLQKALKDVQTEKTTIKQDGQKVEAIKFMKWKPVLKSKYMDAIENQVDNILFMTTTIDPETNEEKRVIQTRETLQWKAGSTFTDIDEQIPLDAEAYRKAVEKCINNLGEENTTENYQRKDLTLDFDTVMNEVKEIGNKIYELGKMQGLQEIADKHFGEGSSILDAKPNQVELLNNALQDMKVLLAEG